MTESQKNKTTAKPSKNEILEENKNLKTEVEILRTELYNNAQKQNESLKKEITNLKQQKREKEDSERKEKEREAEKCKLENEANGKHYILNIIIAVVVLAIFILHCYFSCTYCFGKLKDWPQSLALITLIIATTVIIVATIQAVAEILRDD